MTTGVPRILLAAPDESLIQSFYGAIPKEAHNILALNVLDQPPETVIEYARTSSIEVIISRGGCAECLHNAQKEDADAIPIVQIQMTPFDIIDAVREAQKLSCKMAFIAYASMLRDIKKITDLFTLDVRFVSRSAPRDCLESIFTALEHKAEVIVGDARVVKICSENTIPCVPLRSGRESLRQACLMAQRLIEVRDGSRRETRRLGAILDQLDQALFGVNNEGKVLYSNAVAERMLGFGKKQLLGLDIQGIPVLRRGLWESLHAESSGKASVLLEGSGQAMTACWKKMEGGSFGIDTLIFIRKEKGKAGAPKEGKGHNARFCMSDIIGSSPALQKAKKQAKKYAQSDASILLRGPTGVGKELFAHAIHRASSRCGEPFVAINLAALPATLMESELFGYVRGAFTDARREGKRGVFEYAGNGTVFLDEIGEISLEMQSRLLRVLQDGEFMRLGDDKIIRTHCRVIAATNKPLEEAIRRGQFREDLFYRLNVLCLRIPSLSERREDIHEFVHYFLKKYCINYNKYPGIIDSAALRMLFSHEWRGNVRELQSIIERYVVLFDGDIVNLTDKLLSEVLFETNQDGVNLVHNQRNLAEPEEILRIVYEHKSMNEAAAILGCHRSTLWRRLKKIMATTHHQESIKAPAASKCMGVGSASTFSRSKAESSSSKASEA